MTPHCHNNPGALAGRWVTTPAVPNQKPRFRWSPHRMTRGCKAWAMPVAERNGMPVYAPDLSGWDCTGCRWYSRGGGVA